MRSIQGRGVAASRPTQLIANLVSTHREAVSRELNKLVTSKLIMRQGTIAVGAS
ncbi:MAG: hypothetical protein IPH22_01005 [Nitrosomonas sp.]|nr:hypothetical protein [Nitrosomonas sp.]